MKKQLIITLVAIAAVSSQLQAIGPKNTVRNESGVDVTFKAKYIGGKTSQKELSGRGPKGITDVSKGVCLDQIFVYDEQGNKLCDYKIKTKDKCSNHQFVIKKVQPKQPTYTEKQKREAKQQGIPLPIIPKAMPTFRVDW